MIRPADRIAGYAYRYWHRHAMTEWPTVRQVRRALRLCNAEIENCSGDGPYQLTGYNFEDAALGNLFVEADTPEVERAWCGYWLPYSAGCYCGHHKHLPFVRPTTSTGIKIAQAALGIDA
jgi:hypothetical protein